MYVLSALPFMHEINHITGDAAITVRADGTIVDWNPEAEKLLGFTASETLGLKCWKVLLGRDVFGNRYCDECCPLRKMMSRGEPIHGFPMSFKSADGGWVLVHMESVVVFDPQHNALLLHVFHDSDLAGEHMAIQRRVSQAAHEHPDFNLTEREAEVLVLLGDGNTTREIALRMSVSDSTVRNHVQNLMGKLKVHNRLEAVTAGRKYRLI